MTTLDVLNLGTPVSIIGYFNNEPQSAVGTVCSDQPLIVEVCAETTAWVSAGSSLKVLFQSSGNFESAEAKVESVSKFGNKVRIELEQSTWEKSNRRSYERYDAKLLARCRLVAENSNGLSIAEYTVTTNDISLGGAWIQADISVSLGAILNCELSTGPESLVKVLAVVAWVDPNGKGFGIEFFDFYGSSRSTLQDYLTKFAA